MRLPDSDVLRRLGEGRPVADVAREAEMSTDEFESWWSGQLASRLPDTKGTRTVGASVEIMRDEWGIPSIYADTEDDLFFGYGYAMAQDRLWQLDYLRRKAMGRLSEVLGPSSLDVDIVARTVGINRIAVDEITRLPAQTVSRLKAMSRGINAAMQESSAKLPIEFDLLGYAPEPWSPVDSVAIWAEFRWYLTGRLPVIALPELAKRALGDGPLYQAFLTGEAEEESILSPGAYPSQRSKTQRVGEVVSDSSEGQGSNNWVIGGSLTESGHPLLASDPHIAFGSVSCWYEVHLSGAGFNAAGAGYIGVPGMLFGRNERVAWGLTNNICAQRDLYQEQESEDHPGQFLYDGNWEQATTIEETIKVKGAAPVVKQIRFSRNGPIVDEILPAPARNTGPVSLRWMGHEPCDEITSMLNLARAGNASEFRESLRTWIVPTFSFGFADVDGHIGYQSSGHLPIKEEWGRGYRPGWDSDQAWQEIIPFDAMPSIADPSSGWIRSANNRTAPEDFPYPLSGVWSSGYRAQRIRNMLEENGSHTRQGIARMQLDTMSLRAAEALPGLIAILEGTTDPRLHEAAGHLAKWDCRMEPDRVGASLFEVFFEHWTNEVSAERFSGESVALLAGATSGLSTELLTKEAHGWFENGDRAEAICRAMQGAIADLEGRIGSDMAGWNWGAIHKVALRHHLSERGEIFERLDRGGDPVGGSGITVSNTGFDPNYMAAMGANFRLNADLADNPPGLWAVDAAGQSGNPGSPNYCDQLPEWQVNRHHHLPLDRKSVEANARNTLVLKKA